MVLSHDLMFYYSCIVNAVQFFLVIALDEYSPFHVSISFFPLEFKEAMVPCGAQLNILPVPMTKSTIQRSLACTLNNMSVPIWNYKC